MCDNAANVLNHIYKEGRLKALAIGAPPRIPELPDIPAMAEFFPDFLASSWFGASWPHRKRRRPSLKSCRRPWADALRMPDTVKRLHGLGATPVGE